ncbi:hypothetical protein RRG08_061976 [Elysia crispata]|uniref:Uncharacterized protein n=1 Tax=Elysia crispata TaxID=231223 RepID=A0AAE1A433_9GAST|nr:hypothetical protein RRG08_061976 [Elysia crispata]
MYKYHRRVFVFALYKVVKESSRSTPPMFWLYVTTTAGQGTSIIFFAFPIEACVTLVTGSVPYVADDTTSTFLLSYHLTARMYRTPDAPDSCPLLPLGSFLKYLFLDSESTP